jgi:dTDP-4-dehydrorhamnose reductase
MRCLILGASGQVGRQLFQASDDRGHAGMGTYHRRAVPGLTPLDIRDRASLGKLFDEFEPDVTFLPAAETHMDAAEADPSACLDINVGGAQRVAEHVARTRGRLVFFSTDHVFAECRRAMTEADPVLPQSIYAKAKAAAEAVIRQILPTTSLILRTSWVFGPDEAEKNFVYSTVRRLNRGETITVANDQFGQPTYAVDLADAAMDLIAAGKAGTFHVVGPDRHSKFTFARMIAHVFGFDCDQVVGVPSSQLSQVAPRPKNVWLSGQKLVKAVGPHPVRRPGLGLRGLRDTVIAPATPAWA